MNFSNRQTRLADIRKREAIRNIKEIQKLASDKAWADEEAKERILNELQIAVDLLKRTTTQKPEHQFSFDLS